MNKITRKGENPLRINEKKPEKVENTPIKETEVSFKAEINLNNDPACILGQSQIPKSTFDPKKFDPKIVENMENLMAFINENPEFVKQSERIFENNFKKGEKDSYGKALATEEAFIDEFSV